MIELEYFHDTEFNYPEDMDEEFLEFLDQVRDGAGIKMFITSDGRSPSENVNTGGWVDSYHLVMPDRKACAVDFHTSGTRDRIKELAEEDRVSILWGIFNTDHVQGLDRAFQLGLYHGNDWHFHLALRPKDDGRPSRIYLAYESF